MRSVRRGMVAAALAFPLAFGFAGVATAGEKEVEAYWAEYEANYAFAGSFGAAAGDVSSGAGLIDFKDKDKGKGHDNGKDHGDKGHNGKDKGKGHDNGKDHGDKSYGQKYGWSEYENKGAAAGFFGAGAWGIDADSGYFKFFKKG
ncbi:hypothetical protein [Saccharomonospora viridis]|uniref:Uncharacterized protein n=1 Tax=Saccharomonospora viridis (strain ATCC 15386 / DSM 43017 / JCM 3036 / CCUG 5913 / NBRC 12207 / NCIMB 9602 / P101) TaxID=471857 RepID=C7MQ29_SACVD|nr:hypothetical protein [Saccharomonospora viridis]ACU98452.1 hypothetical protein Svir_34900 [Saccharomonospora viridis DSM 43017]